jgi:hypothetical protein
MPTTSDSRPSAITYDVEALVTMAWDGKIRIPHFQRDFRWSWEDVRKLFDSIVKGYPIGSLLLWTRPAEAESIQLGALRINAPALSDAYWVVDGQQSLTSLANALHPNGHLQPRFAIAYDLQDEDFVHTPSIENPYIIPLPIIFDLQQILKWFAKYPHISSEYLDEATSITRKIRQFEVPAYLVSQEDPRVLQDIFDRMNNYGKRLSRAEIFSALNAGDEADKDRSLSFEGIADRIDIDLLFGRIDNDTVLGAILARRGTEVRRDIRNEFTGENDEGRDAAYRAGEEALRRAVIFLQTYAEVPHVSMLAYRYLLVVLSRLFAFYPEPDARNLQLLRRWYWQAAVAGPEQFRGGTPNAARLLCTQVVENDLSASVQGLLAAVRRSVRPSLDLSRFSTNEASTKMLLCVWWSFKPRDLRTGEPYDLADLAYSLADQQTARSAVRYLVPRISIPLDERPWAANRALMPNLDVDGREVSVLISNPPIDLDEETWTAVLESHSISGEMASLAYSERFQEFIDLRQQLLGRSTENFLNHMAEWKFEDTPPLSIFVIEDNDEFDE